MKNLFYSCVRLPILTLCNFLSENSNSYGKTCFRQNANTSIESFVLPAVYGYFNKLFTKKTINC